MNRLNRRNLSSGRVALIISVVALVLALAGTAFSGGSAVPGKNGVKASDIAKGAVKEGKLAGGAVTAAKIAGGAVTEAKIGAKAVTSEKVFLSGGRRPRTSPPSTRKPAPAFPFPRLASAPTITSWSPRRLALRIRSR